MKLTLKHALAAFILVLSFTTPVVAGHFEDGLAAVKRGDYSPTLHNPSGPLSLGHPTGRNASPIIRTIVLERTRGAHGWAPGGRKINANF
jgi:hypothetical protein